MSGRLPGSVGAMSPVRAGSTGPLVARVPASVGFVCADAFASWPLRLNIAMRRLRFLYAMPAAAETTAMPPALPPRLRAPEDPWLFLADDPIPGSAPVRLSIAFCAPDFCGCRRPGREKRAAERCGACVLCVGMLGLLCRSPSRYPHAGRALVRTAGASG